MTPPTPGDRFSGFDFLRLFAILLVFVQHANSIFFANEWDALFGLTLGQAGVAVFLAISGFLAGRSRRPPVAWLVQRMMRILPAYWIALGASFLFVAVFGRKQFGADQVAAQFLGVGLWTHGQTLVNTPTWFVSFLLACFIAVAVGRSLRVPAVLTCASAIVFAGWMWWEPKPWLTAHACVFSAAAAMGFMGVVRPPLFFLLAAALGTSAAITPEFFYPAFGIAALGLGLLMPTPPDFLARAAEFTYEFFLVHGPILVASHLILGPWSALAIVAAAVASMLAAFLLHGIVQGAARRFAFKLSG